MIGWIRHLPRDSALAREQNEDVEWGLPEQLLAAAVDVLMWANYQRAGGKGPKPKPIPRPGVKDTTRRYGKTTLPPERVKEILAGYARGDYATEGGGHHVD